MGSGRFSRCILELVPGDALPSLWTLRRYFGACHPGYVGVGPGWGLVDGGQDGGGGALVGSDGHCSGLPDHGTCHGQHPGGLFAVRWGNGGHRCGAGRGAAAALGAGL